MEWKHPKYWKELKRIAKEEADKRASEQAKRGERASKRAIKRQGSERASNAEYDPNR